MILDDFKNVTVENDPYPHARGELSWNSKFAEDLNAEMLSIRTEDWYRYENSIEKKLTLSDWSKFGPRVYQIFSRLCSQEVVDIFRQKFGYENLVPDFGLHGGGMHRHENGGVLNPHLDYDVHPKIYSRRRINLIMYVNPHFSSHLHGGSLGLYARSERDDLCGEMVKELIIDGLCFVAFDTSQNSWHGLATPVIGQTRLSLAMYYVEPIEIDSEQQALRKRARFSPTVAQRKNTEVLRDIQTR